MPHITMSNFKDGLLCELDTDNGWMKVTIVSGGLHTHQFDVEEPNHVAKMEKLRLWFLGHGDRNLILAVPELTKEEVRLILAGKQGK